MKYLFLGLLIVALLLGACQISQNQITLRTDAIAGHLEKALHAVQSGNQAEARRLLEYSAVEWDRHEGVLASLMSHSHTGEVSASLAELDAVPDRELERLTLRLLNSVRKLAAMERPIWRNIF